MIIKHREYQNLTQKCGGMTDILESLEEVFHNILYMLVLLKQIGAQDY